MATKMHDEILVRTADRRGNVTLLLPPPVRTRDRAAVGRVVIVDSLAEATDV